MSSSPLQHIPFDAASETHGNDNGLPPTTPQSAITARPSLSPADCRTLKKILEDIRIPSPSASTSASESLLSFATAEDESSDPGNEDEVQYNKKKYEYGDEAEEGYEDEDDSMELSDVAEEHHEVIESNVERDAVWSDGDTIEDMMNIPGDVAPPTCKQDLSGFYSYQQPTPEVIQNIKVRRATIEQAVEAERLEQEKQSVTVAMIEDDATAIDTITSEYQDDTVDLSDDPDFEAVQAVQAQIGMRMIGDEEEASTELEYFDNHDRRASRLFSPGPFSRRISEDAPLSSPSFFTFPSEPLVVPCSGGRHLEFTPSAIIPDTPYTKTPMYFKQYKGKENSPSKSRRNASLPEEIAELLARDTEEDEDLDKYREMDLAPMEPVMGSAVSGDLIMLDPLSKSRDPSLFGSGSAKSSKISHVHCRDECKQDPDEPTTSPRQSLRISPRLSQVLEISPSLFIEQDEDGDTDTNKSDAISNANPKQLIIYPQHPTFVTVIGMLPKAIFWTTAAPIASISNKAYDTMVEKLRGLKL